MRPLAWGTDDWRAVVDEQRPDLVLLADCVYWQSLFQPLADTLEALCNEVNGTAPREQVPQCMSNSGTSGRD